MAHWTPSFIGTVSGMAQEHHLPRRRPLALATAVLGFVMVAIYITVIAGEDGNSIAEVLPWAIPMAIAAFAAAGSAVTTDPRIARYAMVFAALVFALLGLVSILSIGIGFLLTAAVAVAAIGESRRRLTS